MPLAPGTQLGPYQIVAPLGKGGMGEVYRARDPRLGREVAIKALPVAFAQDPERLARFEREAKLLASLSHPNVGAIYGLEEVGGHRYLVLELLDGETLATRLARGSLPPDEAIEVCRQIAAALESAHESGVVHRDLKPGNVMLTPSGVVKVLDFGLAKSGAAGASSDPDLSASPTMTYAATSAGVILGTAAYMSPEQARGRAVDKRTDIWSFGCVLFECLAGRQCFAGETVSDMIARILQGEPEWAALPSQTPGRVRELLRRCLEKDARRRLRDIGDARIELEDVLATRSSGTSIAATGGGRGRSGGPAFQVAVAILAALAGVIATKAVGPLLHRVPPRTPVRFEIPDAEGMNLDLNGAHSAISPDGRTLVFVAGDSTRSQLWVRSMETLAARPLAGTDGAVLPFWSPDSRNIGFFTETQLRRIPAAGGESELLCDVKKARGGSWNRQDVIVYAPLSDGPIYRIRAGGGDPAQITTLDSTRHETAHRFPYFLPDGRHFLYSALPPKDGKFEIYVGSLDSHRRERLLSAGSGVAYAEPGYLLFLRNATLVAQPFDAARRRLRGEPVSLRESMFGTNYSGGLGLTVSANGTLAYVTYKAPDTRLAWADLDGHETARVPLDPGPYVDVQLAPDDRRVALVRQTSIAESDIWIGDLERGVATRFSQEPGVCGNPRWSPDGTRIAYTCEQLGPQRVVVRPVSGTAPATTLLQSDPLFKELYTWSPDGRSLVFGRQDPATRWDLWLMSLEGDRQPRLYLGTPFSEQGGEISEDGRWMVYNSNESGRPECYVQPFPTPGSKYQVTNGGGFSGGWVPGGRQLRFFLNSSPGSIMVADIVPGSEFRLGPMRTLCRFPREALTGAITRDARRELELLPARKPSDNTITVVLDWPGTLKKR